MWTLITSDGRRLANIGSEEDARREGMQLGTVTDVGTVLIQIKTHEGASRVVCPWELVRIRAIRDGLTSGR
jgi:hypothetical protein